jgi:sulfur-oxidizing protein SoxY
MSRKRAGDGASRREILAVGAGALTLLTVGPARATPEKMAEAVKAFTNGAEPRKGRVALEIPALVENGNSVPLKVWVESPMTAQDHVKSIAIFNERNPQPNVANFYLSPRAGRALVSTRIRVADTQSITAVAEMSDGSVWSASAEVVVTIPACVES